MRRWSRVRRPPVPAWVVETQGDEAAYLWAEVNWYDPTDEEILGAWLSHPRPYDEHGVR